MKKIWSIDSDLTLGCYATSRISCFPAPLLADMSENIEIGYPIVAAKLQHDGFGVSGWGMLVAVILGAYTIWLSVVANRMINIPIAMEEEVPDRKKRIEVFVKDTRRLFMDSYNKVRGFVWVVDKCFEADSKISSSRIKSLESQRQKVI